MSEVQWTAMQSSQALNGINVKATKGPDGRFIVVMDRTQWQQMQINMTMVYTQTIMQQINVQAQPGTFFKRPFSVFGSVPSGFGIV